MTELASIDWEQVRAEFSLDPALHHLDAMLLASHPRRVREAIERHRKGLNDDPSGYVFANARRLITETADAAGRYFAMPSDRIALTDSTTMGLALIFAGVQVRRDQQIVTTDHAFFAAKEALRFRAQRDSIPLRFIRLFRKSRTASKDEMLLNVANAIGPETRLLALTWVHSSTGVKLPIAEIGEIVQERNKDRSEEERLILCVDGVHGVGVEDVTFDELKCDFLVSGCHKWLFGPRGTGVVCGTEIAWRQLTPVIPTFTRPDTFGGRNSPGGVHSYELRWALKEAFEFHTRHTKASLERRTHALNLQLKEGLDAIRGVTVVTPMDGALSAGIVCCDVDGHGAGEVVGALREKKVVATESSTDMNRRRHVRFSPSILNNEADIKATLDAMSEIARS